LRAPTCKVKYRTFRLKWPIPGASCHEGGGGGRPAEAQIVGSMTHHLPTHLGAIDAPVVLAVAFAPPPQAREGRRKRRVRLEPAHVEIEGAVQEVSVGACDELANLVVADGELERLSVVELDAALLPAWLAHGHFAHRPLQDLLLSLLLRHGVVGHGAGDGELGLELYCADVVSVVRKLLHAACRLARLDGGGGALRHLLVLCVFRLNGTPY
jgi:hypothetical protein